MKPLKCGNGNQADPGYTGLDCRRYCDDLSIPLSG